MIIRTRILLFLFQFKARPSIYVLSNTAIGLLASDSSGQLFLVSAPDQNENFAGKILYFALVAAPPPRVVRGGVGMLAGQSIPDFHDDFHGAGSTRKPETQFYFCWRLGTKRGLVGCSELSVIFNVISQILHLSIYRYLFEKSKTNNFEFLQSALML